MDPTPRAAKPTGCLIKGSLKVGSHRQRLVFPNGLLTYVMDAGHLAGNRLVLRRRSSVTATAPPRAVERFLEQPLWEWLLPFIEELPTESERQRASAERIRYRFALLDLLGPRVNEIARPTIGSFFQQRGHPSESRHIGNTRALSVLPRAACPTGAR